MRPSVRNVLLRFFLRLVLYSTAAVVWGTVGWLGLSASLLLTGPPPSQGVLHEFGPVAWLTGYLSLLPAAVLFWVWDEAAGRLTSFERIAADMTGRLALATWLCVIFAALVDAIQLAT